MDRVNPQEFITSLNIDPERLAVAEFAVREFVELSSPVDMLRNIESATSSLEILCAHSNSDQSAAPILFMINLSQRLVQARLESHIDRGTDRTTLHAVNT